MKRTEAVKADKIPAVWTTVARERGGRWIPIAGGDFSIQEIRSLYDSGLILMAQRRGVPSMEDPLPPMELVIKAR